MERLIKCVFCIYIFGTVGHRLALGQIVENSPIAHELQDSNVSYTMAISFMNGTVHETVKRYSCAWTNLNNSHPLLYGSKAWTFPIQDVKLDLSYPGNNKNTTTDVLISMFDVILRIDGTESRGYVTAGGILQDNISLTFIIDSISSLEYEFWLYGIPKSTVTKFEQLQYHDFC